MDKLRAPYLWKDVGATDHRTKGTALKRQRRAATTCFTPSDTPNLDQAAELLTDTCRHCGSMELLLSSVGNWFG
ncbi:MAG: hypothetical protein Q7T05_02560 [Dehalococcoidia bacterium]|nr:hypothetical protein [Dehalococcoidia bacterium]